LWEVQANREAGALGIELFDEASIVSEVLTFFVFLLR
jgi:hypothetical protein